MCIYDAKSGEELESINVCRDGVDSAIFSSDSTGCFAIDPSGQLSAWDIKTKKKKWSFEAKGKGGKLFSISGAKQIILMNDDRELEFFMEADGKPVFPKPIDTSWYTTAAYSNNGKWLACGTLEGKVTILDAATKKLVVKFPAHNGPVVHLVYLAGDKKILTMGGEPYHDLKLWNAASGKLESDLDELNDAIHRNFKREIEGDAFNSPTYFNFYHLAVSGDGNQIALSSKAGSILNWGWPILVCDLAKGGEVRVYAKEKMLPPAAFGMGIGGHVIRGFDFLPCNDKLFLSFGYSFRMVTWANVCVFDLKDGTSELRGELVKYRLSTPISPSPGPLVFDCKFEKAFCCGISLNPEIWEVKSGEFKGYLPESPDRNEEPNSPLPFPAKTRMNLWSAFPKDPYLICSYYKRSINIWNIDKYKIIESIPNLDISKGEKKGVSFEGVCLSPNRKDFTVINTNGTLGIYEKK